MFLPSKKVWLSSNVWWVMILCFSLNLRFSVRLCADAAFARLGSLWGRLCNRAFWSNSCGCGHRSYHSLRMLLNPLKCPLTGTHRVTLFGPPVSQSVSQPPLSSASHLISSFGHLFSSLLWPPDPVTPISLNLCGISPQNLLTEDISDILLL